MKEQNPYQSGSDSNQHRTPRRRSIGLASFSLVLASLTGIAILMTQDRFKKMFIEFEIKMPPLSSVACSMGLPGTLVAIAIVTFGIGSRPRFHSIANRASGMVIALTILVLLFYILGVISPLLNLMAALRG